MIPTLLLRDEVASTQILTALINLSNDWIELDKNTVLRTLNVLNDTDVWSSDVVTSVDD